MTANRGQRLVPVSGLTHHVALAIARSICCWRRDSGRAHMARSLDGAGASGIRNVGEIEGHDSPARLSRQPAVRRITTVPLATDAGAVAVVRHFWFREALVAVVWPPA